MAERDDNYFEFDDLSQYSLRQRVLIRAAGVAFYLFVRLVSSTVRFEYRGIENLRLVSETEKAPIYVAWHDRLILGSRLLRKTRALVITSKSFDGEYVARFLKRIGYGTIRGSSSRGGVRAMVRMIRASRAGHPIIFMLDGPRGPRHKVKPGPVALARRTGSPIFAISLEPKRYWTLRTWDRMQIPLPFTRALVSYASPIFVDSEDGKDAELQSSLDRLVEEGLRYSGQAET